MAVADLPPRSPLTFQDVCPFYELEGESSRSLLTEFGHVMRQWQDRPSVVLQSDDLTENPGHISFPKAGTMRVRFRMAGAMKPRMIDMDEASDE